MSTTTTNYNLKIMEGTDLVNYLTDTNPNFTALDSIIKGIEDSAFTTATHLQTGTVHELTRVNADSPYIIFTATSNFTYGDSFTVDGDAVTASDSEGSALRTNFFETNHIEFCILNGSSLTFLFGGNAETLSGRDLAYILNSSNHSYNNTSSGLTATNVQTAIDELQTEIDPLDHIEDFTSELTFSNKLATAAFTALKIGKLVIVQGLWVVNSGQTINSSDSIVTVPNRFKPATDIWVSGTVSSSTDKGLTGYYRVLSTGNITETVISTGHDGSFVAIWHL